MADINDRRGPKGPSNRASIHNLIPKSRVGVPGQERETTVEFEVVVPTFGKPENDIGIIASAAQAMFLRFGVDDKTGFGRALLWYNERWYRWDPYDTEGKCKEVGEDGRFIVSDPS